MGGKPYELLNKTLLEQLQLLADTSKDAGIEPEQLVQISSAMVEIANEIIQLKVLTKQYKLLLKNNKIAELEGRAQEQPEAKPIDVRMERMIIEARKLRISNIDTMI